MGESVCLCTESGTINWECERALREQNAQADKRSILLLLLLLLLLLFFFFFFFGMSSFSSPSLSD